MILTVVLFLIFQALFSWATAPMEIIKGITEWSANLALTWLPDAWWRSLLIDGVIAGLGGIVVFLPQILILFFFILILEETGYLPRAAFLLDRIMGSVGLSGRSFIPLLSSFACAIPGIMAARTIPNARDRMVTILIAPLMTCSARLPVNGRTHRRNDHAHHCAAVEHGHSTFLAHLVCLRPAMPVDTGHDQTRNRGMANASDHGWLFFCLGLRRFFCRLQMFCLGGLGLKNQGLTGITGTSGVKTAPSI